MQSCVNYTKLFYNLFIFKYTIFQKITSKYILHNVAIFFIFYL